MHNVGIALHNYEGAHKLLPNDIWTYYPDPTDKSVGSARNYSWYVMLLPFLEQKPLYDSINFNANLYAQLRPDGKRIVGTHLDMLQCPSDFNPEADDREGTAITNYAGSQGFDWWRRRGEIHEGVFGLQTKIKLDDIKDGTSNTIMVGEVASGGHEAGGRVCGAGRPRSGGGSVFRMWAVAQTHMVIHNAAGYQMKTPEDTTTGEDGTFWKTSPYAWGPVYIAAHCINSDWPGPGSVHPGGMHALMGDDQVRFFSENIDYHGNHNQSAGAPSIWMSLNTINGNRFDKVGVP